MNNKIIIIVGPTAVGKTEYAIATAKAVNGEIVSADSMQLYKYMDIGSAKPTNEERAEIRHYLVDEIDPSGSFSVAEYQKLAKDYIAAILASGKVPVISGGTGLYVNSLMYLMDFAVKPLDGELRQKLWDEANTHGGAVLHDRLKHLDHAAAERIHPNNVKKVIRALEVHHASNAPLKSFDQSFEKTEEYDCILIGLTRDRPELYNRINDRVDQLIEKGLVHEVRTLLDMGLTEASISMKGIGYKEIIGYLNGDYTLETAIDKVKQNTRNYAKRQMTWFKRYSDIKWFNLSDFTSKEAAMREVLSWIEKKSDIITSPTNRTIS